MILLSPYYQGLMSQVHAAWCFSWSRMDQPTATPADRQNLRLSLEQMRCAKADSGVQSKLVNQSLQNPKYVIYLAIFWCNYRLLRVDINNVFLA